MKSLEWQCDIQHTSCCAHALFKSRCTATAEKVSNRGRKQSRSVAFSFTTTRRGRERERAYMMCLCLFVCFCLFVCLFTSTVFDFGEHKRNSHEQEPHS